MPIEDTNSENETNKKSVEDNESNAPLGIGIQALSRILRQGQGKPVHVIDYPPVLEYDKILNNEVAEIDMARVTNKIKNYTMTLDWGNITLDFVPNAEIRYEHSDISQVFFKSNPMWNKLFVMMNTRSHNLKNNDYWDKSIQLIKANVSVLKDKITPFEYINLIGDGVFLDVVFLENFYKDVLEVVAEHKCQRFINRHFKTKFSHLIDSDVKLVIFNFFNCELDEKLLTEQITSRIYTIKNSKDLMIRIKSLMLKSLNWEKAVVLQKIMDNNVKVLSNLKNVILVEVRNYEDLCLFAPESWCIKTDQKMFERSMIAFNQQLIKMDFNKLPNNPKSLIGVTISAKGEITDAHDRNNNNILGGIKTRKYLKYKLSDADFLKYLVESSLEIKQILKLIIRERKHLFEFFVKNYEEKMSSFEIEYPSCQNDCAKNRFFSSIMNNLNMPGFYGRNILVILLTENHTKELKTFLNVMKDKIELPRLVFSTTNENIKETTRNVVFNWVKEQRESNKNG